MSDDYIDPPSPLEVILLHPIKVAAQATIGAQMLNDMELKTAQDVIGDRLIFELRTHVYAEKIDTQDQRVPFAKDVSGRTTTIHTVMAPSETAGFVVMGLVALWASIAATLISGSTTFVVIGGVLALIFSVAGLLQSEDQIVDADYETTVSGTVTVRGNYWKTFPDNTRVYPPELGTPVRMLQVQPPDIRFDPPGKW